MALQGVPMITMGDEYGHTKGGNNNTYCHDNFVSTLIPAFVYGHMHSSSAEFCDSYISLNLFLTCCKCGGNMPS
jgi:pullulanase/glycogen debranching enzyme